jgi:uncharacterized protein with NRDE domain
MCTVIISLQPDAVMPVLLVGVRDEVLGRAWERPACHWPQHHRVVGGLDTQAGGTWLAVAPDARRISGVLNGTGTFPPVAGRRSRGELPLVAAAGGILPSDFSRFSPFHLITVDLTNGARLSSWNGQDFSEKSLDVGVTVIVNTGLDPESPRVAHLTPLIAKADRPAPQAGDPPRTAWASWLQVLSAQREKPDDPRAVIQRRTVEGGIPYGSNSVSLTAMSSTYMRYDFITVHDPSLLLTDVMQVLEVRG